MNAAIQAADAAEAGSSAGAGAPGPPRKPLTREEMEAKVQAMRAAKAAAAKEEERLKEIRRREDNAKGQLALAAARKAEVEREEEARKREARATEAAKARTRLALLKDAAERESKGAGGVSEETMLRLRYQQDLVDGKNPPTLLMDVPAELKRAVAGMTYQKSEGIGLTAANLLLLVLGNLLKPSAGGGGCEDKFRRLNFTPGKPAHTALSPAPSAQALLGLLGWVRGAAAEDGAVFFTISPEALAERSGFVRDAIAQIEAAKAAGAFA